MIELIENTIQIAALGICTVLVGYRAARSGRRTWLLLTLATGVYFLGDLYWGLYLVFYEITPGYSFIPDLSWYASYVFLLLLLLEVRGRREKRPYPRWLWIIPVFTAGMCAFYLQWGDWLSNLIAGTMMSLLMWHAGDCIHTWRSREDAGKRRFEPPQIVRTVQKSPLV